MKTKLLQSLLGLLLLLTSACQQESVEPVADADRPAINEVTIGPSVRRSASQAFTIKFDKPSPCQKLKEVKVTSAGLTMNYDLILYSETNNCPTAKTRQDSVQVAFSSQRTGEHTLNFLLNNRLYLVKKVAVIP